MQITVTGRQIDVGQALREHVESELEVLVSKYFGQAIDASVTFSKAGAFFTAEISAHVGRGILVQGGDKADDPYVAFNAAAAHIGKRLRRHKRRLRDHNTGQARDFEALQAQQYVLRDSGEAATDDTAEAEPPMVIAEMTTEVTSMTVEDAVMRMDLADVPAFMFRNSAHGGLNMVYRREDGNIGWLDPRGNREKTV